MFQVIRIHVSFVHHACLIEATFHPSVSASVSRDVVVHSMYMVKHYIHLIKMWNTHTGMMPWHWSLQNTSWIILAGDAEWPPSGGHFQMITKQWSSPAAHGGIGTTHGDIYWAQQNNQTQEEDRYKYMLWFTTPLPLGGYTCPAGWMAECPPRQGRTCHLLFHVICVCTTLQVEFPY